MTLEGTPTDRHARPASPASSSSTRSRPSTRSSTKLRREQGVKAFVVLLHQGGIQSPAARVPGASTGDAYTDVNKCVNFNGPEIIDIVDTDSTRAST